MTIKFLQSFFSNFARNMMFIHLSVAGLFLILWQLEKRDILKTRASELAFGIGAIGYGAFLIGYYVYYKKMNK